VLPAVIVTMLACAPQDRERKEGRASDEWTRMVPFEDGVELVLGNRYGSIEIEGVEGNAMAVRVERVVQAPTEALARDLVPKVVIEEKIGMKQMSLRTEGISGMLIGVSFQTNYRVKVPTGARLRAQTVDGDISVRNIAGRVAAVTVSGNIVGQALRGAVDVRTNAGKVTIDLAAVGEDPVAIRSGRGGVLQLTVPPDANANLSATATNAKISVTGLSFEPLGEQEAVNRPRRVRGRLNRGGTPIELSSVTADIVVYARSTSRSGEP
jgi:hypothetical protein